MQVLETLQPLLAPIGLNKLGLADPAAWDSAMGPARQADALLAGANTIVVIANGGPTLWRSFVADLEANPAGLTAEANPFDAFVRRTVMAADTALGNTPRRWFWAAPDAETHIDFRVLAQLAGIGQASRIGLLLDDVYGPWLGLRAACFLVDPDLPSRSPGAAGPATGAAQPQPEPALSPHCVGCSLCVAACPGAAFPGGRWAVDPCSTFHHVADTCASTCHARMACPVGAAQRYDPEQIVYHYNRAVGRRALRARLQLPPGADPHEGIGPHWGDWRARVDVKGA